MRYLSRRVVVMISVVALAGGLTPGAWADTATPRPAAYPGASYGLDPAGALITVSGHSVPQAAAYPGASYGLDMAGVLIPVSGHSVPQAAAYPGASYGLDGAGHAIHDSSSPSVVAGTDG